MITKEVSALVSWIAENVDAEPLSGLMPYGPIWNVDAQDLLDQISEIWEIPQEEVAKIVNPIRERIEKEMA